MMYSQSEGDTETPREDSPIIFVITDTLKRVHPYPHEAHGLKATDWAASKQGWFSGNVVLTLSVIMQGLWVEEDSRGQTGKTSWSRGMGTSISEDASNIQLPDQFFDFFVTVCWCVLNQMT